MIDKFDRKGNPLDLKQWGELLQDWKYRRVDEDLVNGYRVSTVWLGLDHSFGEGKPLIFETMVFADPKSGRGAYMERYSTEEEALAGHKAVVDKLRRGEKL